MTHRLGLIVPIALALALASCSAQPNPDTPPRNEQPVSPPEPPSTSNPPDQPVAKPSLVSCDKEIAMVCGDGLTDGCLIRDASSKSGALTLYHVCVPTTETAAGQPCEQEIARICDSGLIDACLHSPPVAESHVCVQPPS